jgi:DNA-binding response OmpR family regulator
VSAVEDGVAMDAWLDRETPDLVILDLMLPGEDGLSIAKRLKASRDLPIIILSAQGDDVDRIVGLEIGADDYVPKPFNPRELLARIRAVLRRSGGPPPDGEANVLQFGDFTLDLDAHELRRGETTVELTSGEYDLLAVFASHPNKVLNRDRILDLLKGAERSPYDRSIDVRVTRLRAKIEPDPARPAYIRTVWGKGYLFSPQAAEA